MPISTFSLLASCDDHWHCTCLQSCRLSWYWRGHWWHCGCWYWHGHWWHCGCWHLTWTLMTLWLLTSDIDIDDTHGDDDRVWKCVWDLFLSWESVCLKCAEFDAWSVFVSRVGIMYSCSWRRTSLMVDWFRHWRVLLFLLVMLHSVSNDIRY